MPCNRESRVVPQSPSLRGWGAAASAAFCVVSCTLLVPLDEYNRGDSKDADAGKLDVAGDSKDSASSDAKDSGSNPSDVVSDTPVVDDGGDTDAGCDVDPTINCFPYVCVAGFCSSTCSKDADCAPSTFCDPVLGKCQVNGPGCRLGPRRGFKDSGVWPNIASCGDTVGFVEAFANSAQTCDDGWHACTIQDLNGYTTNTVPDGEGGWVKYDDPATITYVQSANLACSGQIAISNLSGTSPCDDTALYPTGFRLFVGPSTWFISHQTAAGCIQHVAHDCGVGGGSYPFHPHPTLCCR